MPRIFHRRSAPVSSGQKVFLATPSYGGIADGYVSSIWNSAKALAAEGVPSEHCLLAGNSAGPGDNRNELVAEFLRTDCTDLVFLDADLYWEASDLLALIRYDRDVVAGAYPVKDEVESRFPVQLPAGEYWAEADGLLEAESVPGGFLRIRRHVIEKLAAEANQYLPNGSTSGETAPIIFEHTFEEGRRYGEDFTFCRKWRRMGGKVYVAPEMRFQHYGMHVWTDTYGAHMRRRMGVSIAHCLDAIRERTDTLETYLEIHRAWDNGAWAAGPDMLMVIANLARTGGPIIEFGSGISTAVARAAAPDAAILVYEHNQVWANKITALLEDCGLPPVTINVVGLVGEPPFYRVRQHGPMFALAICDGPPHREDEDRSGVYPVLSRVLKPGASVVVDDLHFPGAKENFETWARANGVKSQVVNGEKLFGLGVMSAEAKSVAA